VCKYAKLLLASITHCLCCIIPPNNCQGQSKLTPKAKNLLTNLSKNAKLLLESHLGLLISFLGLRYRLTTIFDMIKDYYQILGLARFASDNEVKQAYRALAKKFHPDVNSEGAKVFGHITEAYNILSDIDSRKSYDQKLTLSDPKSQSLKLKPRNAEEHKLQQANFNALIKGYIGTLPLKDRAVVRRLIEKAAQLAGLKVELHFAKIILELKKQAAQAAKNSSTVTMGKDKLQQAERRGYNKAYEDAKEELDRLRDELTSMEQELSSSQEKEKLLKQKLVQAYEHIKKLKPK